MILFVSGRTDIVAFYSEWFSNRIEAGYFDVRNPFDKNLVSRIYKEDIDMYIFCTKNPIPLMNILPKLDKPIQLQITLTGYHKDIEPGVPDKKCIIEEIKKLSSIVGKENIIVRYDPIFLNERYTKEYHIKALRTLSMELSSFIHRIIISFMDDYKNVRNNISILNYHEPTEEEYRYLAKEIQVLSKEYQIPIVTCCEKKLEVYGFTERPCLSQKDAFEACGRALPIWHERECECVQMVDIGAYNTCSHFCRYCYANYDEASIFQNRRLHDPSSSLLVGALDVQDTVKIRR